MRRMTPLSSRAKVEHPRWTYRSRAIPFCRDGRFMSNGNGSTVTRRGKRPSASKASNHESRSSFRRDTLIACTPLLYPADAAAFPVRQTRCERVSASKGNSVSSIRASACSTLARERKGKAQSRNSAAPADRHTRTSSGRFRPAAANPSSRERRPEATACGVRSAQVTWCRYETSRLFSPTRHNAPVSSVPDWRMMKLSLAIIMLSGQGCTSKEGRRKVSRMRTRTSPLSLRDWSVRSGMSSSRTCSSGMRRADCTSMRLAGRSRGTRVTCP